MPAFARCSFYRPLLVPNEVRVRTFPPLSLTALCFQTPIPALRAITPQKPAEQKLLPASLGTSSKSSTPYKASQVLQMTEEITVKQNGT
jgi:hypothetical protein